jgi:hypothetical protein
LVFLWARWPAPSLQSTCCEPAVMITLACSPQWAVMHRTVRTWPMIINAPGVRGAGLWLPACRGGPAPAGPSPGWGRARDEGRLARDPTGLGHPRPPHPRGPSRRPAAHPPPRVLSGRVLVDVVRTARTAESPRPVAARDRLDVAVFRQQLPGLPPAIPRARRHALVDRVLAGVHDPNTRGSSIPSSQLSSDPAQPRPRLRVSSAGHRRELVTRLRPGTLVLGGLWTDACGPVSVCGCRAGTTTGARIARTCPNSLGCR